MNKKLGDDLLSHTLVCSTIGDERLDFWVRDGIRYFPFSNVTKQNFWLQMIVTIYSCPCPIPQEKDKDTKDSKDTKDKDKDKVLVFFLWVQNPLFFTI